MKCDTYLDLALDLSVEVHDVVPARYLQHATSQRSQVHRNKTQDPVCQLVCKMNSRLSVVLFLLF